MPFNNYDFLLLFAVTAQSTVLSYLRAPKWKAFMLSLPIPFSIASLAVGKPVDATNVLGMVVLLVYTWAVWFLYSIKRIPIIPAIIISALGYCFIGGALAKIVPPTSIVFWVSIAGAMIFSIFLYCVMPHRIEPSHRTPLPVLLKAPIIMAVVFCLILIKGQLGGFITMFPMVGVIASYEARHSLWSLLRQIPIITITILPLMATVRLTQDRLGLGWGLAIGWLVFFALLVPMTRHSWAKAAESQATGNY